MDKKVVVFGTNTAYRNGWHQHFDEKSTINWNRTDRLNALKDGNTYYVI